MLVEETGQQTNNTRIVIISMNYFKLLFKPTTNEKYPQAKA